MTFDKDKHTPLPWTLQMTDPQQGWQGYMIYSQDGSKHILDLSGGQYKWDETCANAKYIVHACNNYQSERELADSLGTALYDLAYEHRQLVGRIKSYEDGHKLLTGLADELGKADEVLAAHAAKRKDGE